MTQASYETMSQTYIIHQRMAQNVEVWYSFIELWRSYQ